MSYRSKDGGKTTYVYFLQGKVYKYQAVAPAAQYAQGWRSYCDNSFKRADINTWVDEKHHKRYYLQPAEPNGMAVLTVVDSRSDF